MNTEYLAQRIAVEIKAGFAQADLVKVEAEVKMAAATGREQVTVTTKYPLDAQFIDSLADYGISCVKLNGVNKYEFHFGEVEV